MLVRVVDGTLRPQGQDPADVDRRDYLCEQVGVFTPKVDSPSDELSAGEVGFVIAGHQGAASAAQGRRHAHPAPTRRRPKPLPGFKEIKPQVFAGLYPVEAERVRGAARRAGEAAPQRRVAALRAGDLAGAGLRLPLRLPRPAAHGHRAGAPRARVRHDAHHHRADGGLPGRAARRHRASRSRTRRGCRRSSIEEVREPIIRPADPRAAGLRRPGDHAVHRRSAARRRTCSTRRAR